MAELAVERAERPLPNVDDPLTAPFWASAVQHRLSFQVCEDCGYTMWPAETSCPECLSTSIEWREVSGRGTIWSLAIVEHVLDPFFQPEVPYALGAISLDAGPMLISRVRGVPDELEVGQTVEVVYNDVADGVTLVEFQAADEKEGV